MTKKIVTSVNDVKTSGLIVQGLSTFCIAQLAILSGFVYAWPSYTLENFTSNATVLSWPMSSSDISILGSLTNIGALMITPFCGYLANTLGRRHTAMLFGIPFVLAWLIISLTSYVPLVIACMGIAGIGAGGQAVSTIYIAEISDDSIRGGMTSTAVSGYFLGLLLSYILGGHLTYNQVLYTHLSLSVLYIIMLMLLKDSPVYLVQKGKDKEAAQAIAFYRRCSITSKEVEVEINKIKLQLDPQIKNISQQEDEKSETSKRALTCSLILMAASIMMGAIVLQVYAEPLFKEAVPAMPSNLCSIFLAIDLLVASLICASTVDKFGRKILMTVTSIGSGVLTFLLATQLQFHYAPHWFTAVLIYTYCFVYNLGAATVPFIIPAEVFLPEVRGLCNSFVMACMWITNFVTLIIFNPLVDNFGLGPLFYGFSGVCFLTAVYSHCCLPETKGLSTDAIQVLFLKKKNKSCGV